MDFLISEAKLSLWVLILLGGAVLHTLLWTLVEFRLMLDEDEEQQTSADASDKIIKAIVIAII